MNLILLSPTDFIKSQTRVRLDDRRYVHIRDIHRAKAGDELSVGLIGGRMGTGKIASLTAEAIEMDISLNLQPPTCFRLHSFWPSCGPNILKRTLQSASAMGVKRYFSFTRTRWKKVFG